MITSIKAMRSLSAVWRRQHQVALVPTLGNIHRAHLALVQRAQQVADKVVLSLFLNPLQFDRCHDFINYPRTLEQDCAQLAEHGVHAVFVPQQEEMYPADDEPSIAIDTGRLGNILCGASREQHFNGVAVVVMKLFQIVQPQLAVFGEKDYQQLHLIRQMVRRFNVPVQIVSHPTVREADGLACSSRNRYLSTEQRKNAAFLYQSLLSAKRDLQAGKAPAEIERHALQQLRAHGWRPDYFSIRSAETLAEADTSCQKLVVAAAAYLGSARLIDNVLVSRRAP